MRGVTFGADVAVLRQEAVLERQKRYKELHRREERFKQLKIIADKLQTKQHLSAVSSPVVVRRHSGLVRRAVAVSAHGAGDGLALGAGVSVLLRAQLRQQREMVCVAKLF